MYQPSPPWPAAEAAADSSNNKNNKRCQNLFWASGWRSVCSKFSCNATLNLAQIRTLSHRAQLASPYVLKKWANTCLFFVYFCTFQIPKFTEKTVGLGGIRTRIICVDCFSITTAHLDCVMSSLLKWAIPGLFFIYFPLFKGKIQFLQQINVKNAHPVYIAGIRTHDLQDMSCLQ